MLERLTHANISAFLSEATTLARNIPQAPVLTPIFFINIEDMHKFAADLNVVRYTMISTTYVAGDSLENMITTVSMGRLM